MSKTGLFKPSVGMTDASFARIVNVAQILLGMMGNQQTSEHQWEVAGKLGRIVMQASKIRIVI